MSKTFSRHAVQGKGREESSAIAARERRPRWGKGLFCIYATNNEICMRQVLYTQGKVRVAFASLLPRGLGKGEG